MDWEEGEHDCISVASCMYMDLCLLLDCIIV